jgi:hypothetical protein
MFRASLIAATLFVGLTGFGTWASTFSPEKLKQLPSEKMGVLILSSGAPKPCMANSHQINIDKAGERYRHETKMMLPIDSYVLRSDFSTHQGVVNVVPMAPGDYQLYLLPQQPMVRAIQSPRAYFSVRPGEVVYLGELFLAESCGRSVLPVFRDQQARDMAFVLSRNPKLAAYLLSVRLLKADDVILAPGA